MTSRRISTLAACAAAVMVVGLMALLLRGFGLGSRVGSSGGSAIATAQAQVFAHSGGIEVVATESCLDSTTNCDAVAAQRRVVAILTGRLPFALTDVPALTVQPLGATDIVIDVAGAHSASDILPMLNTGGFAVIDTGVTQLAYGTDVSEKTCVAGCQAGQYQVLFSNTDLDTSSIQVALDRQTGQPIVTFAFAGQARTRFAQYTGSHIGQYLTLVIDNHVIESAVIQSQIDGAGQITGIATAQQAHELAALMKYGPLPVALNVVTTQTVGVGNQRNGGPFAPPCPTPSPFWQPCSAPCVTPTATAAPQAKYVQNVTTAAGVDSTIYSPINITSTFPVNSDVYVTASMRNIAPGESHTLSIRWFLGGTDLGLTSVNNLSKTITKAVNVYFSLRYPTVGLGMAKLYFDRPANDPDSDTAYLAATVYFTIQSASAPVPTPTPAPYAGGSGEGGGPTCPGPTPAPGPTPPPGPTPTPGPTATPGAPPQGSTPTPTAFG
jgi:hypothetical protein